MAGGTDFLAVYAKEAKPMVDAPEKIWATINGASTRLPDGARQLIGGWSQDSERPNVIEYTRSDLVAELAAENERLIKERDYWKAEAEGERAKVAYRDQQALSRTGAVKVKPLEWGPYHNPVFAGPDIAVASFSVFGLQLYQAQRDPQGPGFIVFLAPKYGTEFWSSKGHADLDEAKAAAQADFDRRILSALEPHPRATSTVDAHETANVSDKPEGQQEPVTEAMVVAATEEYFTASFKNTPSDAMRMALKAAMEAGR